MAQLNNKSKKGLSNIVGYVLLISITLALAVLVYSWLKFYVSDTDIPECPSEVDLVVQRYECVSGASGYINFTLKNKGNFNIDGFILRVDDQPDSEFAFYTVTEDDWDFAPGSSADFGYNLDSMGGHSFESLKLLEVQPFVDTEEGRVYCDAYSSLDIECD